MKKIVIIDDDPEFIKLVESSCGLADEKYTIYSALDAEKGFQLALEIPADLYILDIMLPESSGLDISNALDSILDRDTPVIFVSANEMYESKINSTEYKKQVSFVKKPIDAFEFHRTITNSIENFKDEKKRKLEGLTERPWPIVAIAAAHFVEPLIKVLYFKANTGFDFSKILNVVFSWQSFEHFFNFWVLFPLAGLLLYTMKKVPYFVFMALQVYMINLHMNYESYTWPYVSKDPLFFSTLLIIFNVSILVYLSLPTVRRPFVDKAIKWWEAHTRTNISLPCTLVVGDQSFDGNTLNISKSGLYFKTDESFHKNEKVVLKFNFKNIKFDLNAKVMHSKPFRGQKGVGLRFDLVQFGDYLQKVKLLKAIKLLRV